MSEETGSQEAPVEQSKPTQTPGASKPSLEDAFGGEDGKSRLQSNFVRPKKLGISAFNEGADDLSAKSKKGKKNFAKSQDDEIKTSFDPPEQEEKPAPKPDKEPEEKPESKEREIKEPEKEEIKQETAPKKYKVNINGEEMEVSEEELIRGYQIRKASDKVFQEAAEIRKMNEALIRKGRDKEGVLELLQAFGHDPRVLAEEYLTNLIQFEMLTPEQQEIARLRAEKAQHELRVKQAIEEQRREAAERETEVRAQAIQKNIIETMEKNPDLPKDSGTIRRIIEHMRIRIKAQEYLPEHLHEDITPASVLDDVRASIEKDLRTKASTLTPEQLAKFLGKEKLDEYRKWELTQIKNPINKPAPAFESDPVALRPKRHYKTMEEFRENQRLNGIKTLGGRF